MKISKAARQELYSRFIDYNGNPNYQFGHGNNAAIRELFASGMVDNVQFGWYTVPIITRDGWDLASQIHAETMRLRAGVPFSEYTLERGIPLDKPGLTSNGVWHTDGCFMAAGASLNSPEKGSRLTAERVDWDRIVPSFNRLSRAAAVVPVGMTKDKNNAVIWFNDGTAMRGSYYSHIARLYPNGEWRHGSDRDAFYYVHSGEVKGIVMPWRQDTPSGIAKMLVGRAA